jgi:hypothetical protein
MDDWQQVAILLVRQAWITNHPKLSCISQDVYTKKSVLNDFQDSQSSISTIKASPEKEVDIACYLDSQADVMT